jgi:hypothetical protein
MFSSDFHSNVPESMVQFITSSSGYYIFKPGARKKTLQTSQNNKIQPGSAR